MFEKLPEQATTVKNTAMCTVDYATNVCSPQRSAYAQLSLVYLLSTPYVTHVIIYFRPSTTFHYCKRWKAGRGQEMISISAYQHHVH